MELSEFFRANPQAAIAFSGGVDSAYLLWAGVQAGARVKAYYVKTQFQPAFELADAQRLARELGAELEILPVDILCRKEVTANPADRCYYCKRALFETLVSAARKDGFSLVLDGTNASDDLSDRPGVRALRELEVRSPLRECGLTKEEIRRRSKEAGLFTWDKPAYACLATRVPTGTPITAENLQRVEQGENALFRLGFRNFRLRLLGELARLQLPAAQFTRAVELHDTITAALGADFAGVLLDLNPRGEE